MKTKSTYRRRLAVLFMLAASLIVSSVSAQKKMATAAKCAGFTAKITNGSVLNLCNGSSLTLNAAPVESGYSFQWQSQTTAGGPFTNLPDANGSNYKTSALGAYRVIIKTGSCVDTSGITSVIRLNLEGGKITPATTATICLTEPGGLITGTVVPGLDVGIVTFGWEKNEGGGWSAISGASDISYNVGPLYKTTSYRRLAKDNCGNVAYSNTVTLNIAPDLIPGAVAPLSQTIDFGQTAAPVNSSVLASGGSNNYNYQWQWSYYEDGPWENVTGATSSSYSPGAIQQTTYYRRLVIDARCSNMAATATAVVFVTNGILNAGTFIISSQCFFLGGQAATLQTNHQPSGGTPPYKIQWQSATDNRNFSNIPGANSMDYNPGYLTQTTYFRRMVTDAKGKVAYSNAEVITLINTPLTGGTIKATANVACLGSNPATIASVSSPTGYSGLSYQWQYKTVSNGGVWTDIPNQVRDGLYPDPITEKTWFRRVAIDRCGTNTRTANSNEVEIDIRPALIAGDIEPTSQMIRPGGTPRPLNSVTGPSGGTGSYTLSWQNAELAVGPWSTITNVNTLGYQPPSLTHTNYYRRVVMDNNCLATKYTYTVEVYLNNAPPVTSGTLTGSSCVFPGGTPTLITTGEPASGGQAPYTYSWEMRTGTSGAWTIIAGASGESYQPTAISQTTQYRRKVIDNWGESSYTAPFTVTFNTVALTPGTIAIKSSNIVCAGSTPGLIESVTPLSGSGENQRYKWQIMFDGGLWADIQGATGASYQPGAITKRTYFRRVAIESCGGVVHTANSNVVVFELPVPVKLLAGLVDGPFITCAGTAPGTIRSVLDACGGNSSLHYQWEVLNGGSWQSIAGATGASYSPGAINMNMTYRRKVYDDCGNVGYSNSVEIYVYPPIEPGIIGTETQTVCGTETPATIRLITNCHYTDGTVTYQWQSATSAGGPWNNINGAVTNSYSPAASATTMYYRLQVRSTTCSFVAYTNLASVIVNSACKDGLLVGGSKTVSAGKSIKVFPNPLTGNTVAIELETKGKVNVRLQNAEGRSIPVNVNSTGSGLMKLSFTRTPSKGMYVLTVNDEQGSYTTKVLVQ